MNIRSLVLMLPPRFIRRESRTDSGIALPLVATTFMTSSVAVLDDFRAVLRFAAVRWQESHQVFH
jgi:hypothetical protein